MTYRQPFKGSWPISQMYGETVTDPLGHRGIDYACPEGTEILASADGIVMRSCFDTTGYGNMLIILHDAKHATLYAHLSKCLACTNQKVQQGDVIGLSGWTGNVMPEGPAGAHLHFEYRSVWNNWTTHKDPLLLPLMTVDDSIHTELMDPQDPTLKDADQFHAGDLLAVTAPAGVKGFFDQGFSQDRMTTYKHGSQFYYTGDTIINPENGYTYMRCVPAGWSVWMAVHDKDTQILDKEGPDG